MKSSQLISLVAVSLALLAAVCPGVLQGALVLRKGGRSPVFGFVITQSKQTIVVRETLPDGASRETTIPRAEVEEIIVTVSPERLADLEPARPQLYREYAEELAEKSRDPEARAAAIRLYQIAAVLDRDKFGPGALLGLISLARSADEAAKFRAAAYLLDPRHDSSFLSSRSVTAAEPAARNREALGELLRALRWMRRGQGVPALELASRSDVQEVLKAFADKLAADEFAVLCRTESWSTPQLEKVLALELAIEAELAGKPAAAERVEVQMTRPWSELLSQGELQPAPALQLESLTEFDPQACLFRAGKWVRPAR